MKKVLLLRILSLLVLSCFFLTAFCACSDSEDEFENPSISGEKISDWPVDEAFSIVPEFTEGTFDESNSTLKSGCNLLFFTGVERDAYDRYYQALTNAGFTDAISGGGNSSMVLSARFSNEDKTVLVNLNYKITNQNFTINLINAAETQNAE